MTLPLWGPPDAPRAGQAARTGPGRPPPRRLALVRLAGEIAQSMARIGRVAVEGEVHRPQVSRGGWVYFTLRDRAAQLPVACPARNARRCHATAGERVLVVGSLVWGNDRGQLVLEAEEVTPLGEGAVAALIAAARASLAADGLLDRPRRRLPRLPEAIGVVCGSDAAVRKDIESVVAERFPGYPLCVEETTVTGPGAALSITEALARLSERPEVGVVVLARGGGDATALLPWSDEELCRAVAAFPVPVVSAIGHDPDRPLCDEVADLRCGTPSLAAYAVVPDRRGLERELAGFMGVAAREVLERDELGCNRLGRCDPRGALATSAGRARERARHAAERLAWSHPRQAFEAGRLRLAADWRRPFAAQVASCRAGLGALHRQAASLSPQRVIERGFAVVRRADGAVVRGPEDVVPGETIAVQVARGAIAATVQAPEGPQ